MFVPSGHTKRGRMDAFTYIITNPRHELTHPFSLVIWTLLARLVKTWAGAESVVAQKKGVRRLCECGAGGSRRAGAKFRNGIYGRSGTTEPLQIFFFILFKV